MGARRSNQPKRSSTFHGGTFTNWHPAWYRSPVLLGAGKRLFDGIERTDIVFERTAVIESPFATHLRYRIRDADDPLAEANRDAA